MNVEKAKKYIEDRLESLEESRVYTIEEASMSGPMSYEDRMAREDASRRLVWLEKEIAELSDILGGETP